MTFNATFIPIEDLRAAGFVEYHPPGPIGERRRRVFVAHDVARLLDKGDADEVMFNWVEANAILSTFVAGRMVSASLEGRRCEVEKLVDVDEVWACCIRKPRPGWRIFGRFVAQDCLVLVRAHDRHALAHKSNYHAAAVALINEWDNLLPNVPPYRAAQLAGYVSGVIRNVDED